MDYIKETISSWATAETLTYNNKNTSDQVSLESLRIKIFTFGSYKQCVHNSESDIDALCVVPKHLDRQSFFNNNLQDRFKDNTVTEFNPLPTATVPVIKMKINDVEIDLLFAQ